MQQGFADGCYTFMVPTNEPNPDWIVHAPFDPIWAGFAERLGLSEQ